MERVYVHREMRRLDYQMRRFMEDQLRKRAVERVTGPNGCILAYMAENGESPVYMRDLERVLGITRSTASKIVALMVQKDLLRLSGVPEDARLKQLCLTEKGADISRSIGEDFAQMNEKLLAGFAPEETRQLHDYLRRMRANLQEAEENWEVKK